MTNKEKKVVFTIVAIMVLILVIIVCVKSFGNKKNNNTNTQNTATTNEVKNEEKYVTELNDGTKLNNSQDFNKVKKYGDLEITNIQFTSRNGSSVLLADVKNTGSKTHEKEVVKITILGENGEVLATPLVVLTTVAPGETKQLNVIVTADIANAKDFKIEAQ